MPCHLRECEDDIAILATAIAHLYRVITSIHRSILIALRSLSDNSLILSYIFSVHNYWSHPALDDVVEVVVVDAETLKHRGYLPMLPMVCSGSVCRASLCFD